MTNPTPAVPPPIVEDGGDVYYNEVNDAVRNDVLKHAVVFTSDQITTAWTNSPLSHLQLISTNKQYKALPTLIWKAILHLHLSLHEYQQDFYDCDSFSLSFAGQIVADFAINGICRVLDVSGSHSYNAVLICDDGKTCRWRRIEPQADKFVSDLPKTINVTAPDGAYKATRGFAITA